MSEYEVTVEHTTSTKTYEGVTNWSIRGGGTLVLTGRGGTVLINSRDWVQADVTPASPTDREQTHPRMTHM